MKKLLFYLLILLLFCGCAKGVESCPTTEEPAPEIAEPVEEGAPKVPEETEEVIQEGHYEEPDESVIEEVDIIRKTPCKLQVANGSRVGDALGGAASWWYDNGDGTATAIEAERLHPLNMKDHIPVLVMDGTAAELLFGAETPDKVSMRGWSVSEWGNYEAEAGEIPVDGLQFELKNEGFIYEVFATWDRFENWGGTAYYVFCAAPLGVELHAEAVTDKGMTLVCTQSGGNPSGELQTGQPYWIEQRDENGSWISISEPQFWEDIAYLIPQNDAVRWNLNWEHSIGSLPDGTYRVGKEIMDFRGTGDYDTYRIWSDNFSLAWVD